MLEAVIVGVLILVVITPSAVGPALSVTATALIGLVASVFRRLNSDYHLTVAEAPDGLAAAVRSVPDGRRDDPPRAGPGGPHDRAVCYGDRLAGAGWWSTSPASSGPAARTAPSARPSGPSCRSDRRQQAAWLLERILPAVPSDRVPPPRRARWKSPLRYRFLSWGGDRTYAVTTSGRVRRVTDWVPLAKVQSIRQVEGPVQRRLRLATVHLDTAGRNIHAALRDRDRDECARLMAELPAGAGRPGWRPRAAGGRPAGAAGDSGDEARPGGPGAGGGRPGGRGGAAPCRSPGIGGSAVVRRRVASASAVFLRLMADRLDIVAVGVPHEGAVIVGVILGPDPRRVEHLGSAGHGRVEEGPHRGPVGGDEGQVGLSEPFPSRLPAPIQKSGLGGTP